MKNLLFVTIFILLSLASGFGQETECDFYLRQMTNFNLMNAGYRGNGFAENYDLKYHRFSWFLDPKQYFISGEVMSVFSIVDDSTNFIEFELTNSLQVDSVIYQAKKAAIIHKPGGILRISFTNYLKKKFLDSVIVFYHGQPESNGMGSFVKDIHNSNVPVIWTLSQPYGSRDWWPCKHSLNDKVDSIDVFIKTTKGNIAASNGVLISENTDSLYYYCHWKHRYPIAAYLIAVAVTNYDRFSDWVFYNNKTLEILNYIYPEDVTTFRSNIAHTVDVMLFFIEKFGFYPFDTEKYGHAQFGRNGGMEHQTMSFMGHFSEMLVSHELAHQWFGDYITCNSWQDIWLNESLATFCDGITTERFQTKESYLTLLKNRINAITSEPNGSVFVPAADTNSVSRVFNYRLSYQKGAMVLSMLRFMMGDSSFFLALRNYLNDPALRFSYSKTDDIQKHMEAVYHNNLDEFFDSWIYKEGYPSYHITYYQVKNHLKIKINQEQSHHSVDFFKLQLPILVKGLYQDTLLLLDNTYNGQIFDVNLAFEADTLFFDPEYKLITSKNIITKKKVIDDEYEGVLVFPNPTFNQLYFQFTEPSYLKNVLVLDAVGNLIYHSGELNVGVTAGEIYHADFWDNKLKNGLYFIRIETSEMIFVRRFVIYP